MLVFQIMDTIQAFVFLVMLIAVCLLHSMLFLSRKLRALPALAQ